MSHYLTVDDLTEYELPAGPIIVTVYRYTLQSLLITVTVTEQSKGPTCTAWLTGMRGSFSRLRIRSASELDPGVDRNR